MHKPLLLHRLRALVAVIVCGSAIVQIHTIEAADGTVVAARTGWFLGLAVDDGL